MKKRSIVNAYKPIRPDEAARDRMLRNILSSEIVPAGKDERKMRKKFKPLLIAAIISLMVLLMGCAVMAFRLQNMKIGESSHLMGQILDSDGNVVKEKVVKRDVISLQGLSDTPGQLAAKEWYEFVKDYDLDYSLVIEADKSGFRAPEEYDAYAPYTQEMVDKVDAIAEKYGLKLAGKVYPVQNWEYQILFDALNLDNLHIPDARVEMEYLSGYFYTCGNFDLSFNMTLTGDDMHWPYAIPCSMRYCGKSYMDTVVLSIDTENYEQWNYVTENGTTVLIIMDSDQARIFCDREDAFISVFLYIDNSTEYMKHRDVEQVADALNFQIKPQSADPENVELMLQASAEQKAAEIEAEEATRPDDTYAGFILDRLLNLEHPENMLYYLMDVDGNGVVDMLLGYAEACETVWTIVDGNLTLPSLTDQDWEKIAELWQGLDTKPITEFPMDE